MKTKSSLIPYIITLIMVTLMVACATWLDEPEIIFPEITALTIGAWLAPEQIWKTSPIRLVGLILIYSLLGVVMVKYIDVPLYVKVISTFFMCLVGLRLSKTTFAPLISAGILPILMGTESWVYPLASTTMALIVVIIQYILEKYGYTKLRNQFASVLDHGSLFLMIERIIVVMIMLALALYVGYPLLIAPPLLVAFVELSGNHHHLRKKAPQLYIVTVLMALISAYARYYFTIKWDISIIITTALVTLILLIVIGLTHTMFPPIGAISILPMIIDIELLQIYPLLIAIGFALFIIFAYIISYKKNSLHVMSHDHS